MALVSMSVSKYNRTIDFFYVFPSNHHYPSAWQFKAGFFFLNSFRFTILSAFIFDTFLTKFSNVLNQRVVFTTTKKQTCCCLKKKTFVAESIRNFLCDRRVQIIIRVCRYRMARRKMNKFSFSQFGQLLWIGRNKSSPPNIINSI